MTKELLQHKMLSLRMTKGHLPLLELGFMCPRGRPRYITFLYRVQHGVHEPGWGDLQTHLLWHNERALFVVWTLGCSICQPQAGTGLPPGRDLAAREQSAQLWRVKYGPVRYWKRAQSAAICPPRPQLPSGTNTVDISEYNLSRQLPTADADAGGQIYCRCTWTKCVNKSFDAFWYVDV